jgi:hypothetical protein
MSKEEVWKIIKRENILRIEGLSDISGILRSSKMQILEQHWLHEDIVRFLELILMKALPL